jgi:dTDP-4-amino-4,6-dideoxygalactose transaminase
MNELIAAYGLLQLKNIEENIQKRKQKVSLYRNLLKNTEGINLMPDINGVKHNYTYFPVFIDKKKLGKSRDEIYLRLRESKYFSEKVFLSSNQSV